MNVIKKYCVELSELTQIKGVEYRERLRVHRALADSLSLVPSTKVRYLTMASKSSSKGIDAPFWLSRASALICTAHTYVYHFKNNKNKSVERSKIYINLVKNSKSRK